MGTQSRAFRKLKRNLKSFFQDVARIFAPPSFKPPDPPPSVPVTAAVATIRAPSTRVPLYAAYNIDELTQFPNWDWFHFRSVLINLAVTGPGIYIPAHRRPASIFLDGLQSTLAELQELSRRHKGRETSRAFFVDRDRRSLVPSGKTRIGSQANTTITLTTGPDGEYEQHPVLTVHVHPELETTPALLDADYVSFLTDMRQIAMVISWRLGVMLVLKSTATLYGLSPDFAQKRVCALHSTYLNPDQARCDPLLSLFSFNMAVCEEFGLACYEAYTPDSLLARRAHTND